MPVEQRATNDGHGTAVAYPLWFFLGAFSGDRFHLGGPGRAALQILSCFILFEFFWLPIDGVIFPASDALRQNSAR
jgi:hypothetical protein